MQSKDLKRSIYLFNKGNSGLNSILFWDIKYMVIYKINYSVNACLEFYIVIMGAIDFILERTKIYV